jgi:hypothetical protein
MGKFLFSMLWLTMSIVGCKDQKVPPPVNPTPVPRTIAQ